MADQTLDYAPNGTTNAFHARTGATTDHEALADDSDLSYVEFGTDTRGQVSLPDTALPVGVLIKGIRVSYRVYTSNNNNSLRTRVVNATTWNLSNVILDDTAAINTYTVWTDGLTSLVTSMPDGSPFTQADINSFQIVEDCSEVGEVRLSRARLQVVYNAAPSATLTGPADEDTNTAGVQVTTTSTPTLPWTYSDPENDAKERHVAKVWTKAVYDGAGFNPETSTPVWSSGEVFSSAESVVVGTPLDLGDYRWSVKVADAGSGGRYSAWPTPFAFSIAQDPLVAPDAPALSATAEADRIRLTVTPQGTNPTEFVRVEYLDDVWLPVRGAERVVTSIQVDVYDYESVAGELTSYRAKAGVEAATGDLYGPASATATATLSLATPMLSDPLDPSTAIPLDVRHTGEEVLPMESTERRGDFILSGVKNPVTVADVISGESFELELLFATQAAYEAFEELRQAQRTLLYRDPNEPGSRKHMYLRLGPVRREVVLDTTDRLAKPQRRVSIAVSERARP